MLKRIVSGMMLTILVISMFVPLFGIRLCRVEVNNDFSTSVSPTSHTVISDESASGQFVDVVPSILIIVEEQLFPKIQNQLVVFEHDLEREGYGVSNCTVTNQTQPKEIREMLKSYYLENDMVGAMLLGSIKAAYSEVRFVPTYQNPLPVHISLDAIDAYYMDLDGYWENVTHPDFLAHMPANVTPTLEPSCSTFYDEYIVYPDETKKWDYSTIENKTQYHAEIWVSRIMAHNLNIGEDEAKIINNFFEWNHKYRTGGMLIFLIRRICSTHWKGWILG